MPGYIVSKWYYGNTKENTHANERAVQESSVLRGYFPFDPRENNHADMIDLGTQDQQKLVKSLSRCIRRRTNAELPNATLELEARFQDTTSVSDPPLDLKLNEVTEQRERRSRNGGHATLRNDFECSQIGQ